MIYDWPNPCQPRKQEETTSPLFGSNTTVLTEHYSSTGQYLRHLEYLHMSPLLPTKQYSFKGQYLKHLQ